MTDSEILAVIADSARAHGLWTGAMTSGLRLVEDLELDSLKALTLAVEVEDRFRICLDPEAEARIVTIGDLVDMIRSELAN